MEYNYYLKDLRLMAEIGRRWFNDHLREGFPSYDFTHIGISEFLVPMPMGEYLSPSLARLSSIEEAICDLRKAAANHSVFGNTEEYDNLSIIGKLDNMISTSNEKSYVIPFYASGIYTVFQIIQSFNYDSDFLVLYDRKSNSDYTLSYNTKVVTYECIIAAISEAIIYMIDNFDRIKCRVDKRKLSEEEVATELSNLEVIYNMYVDLSQRFAAMITFGTFKWMMSSLELRMDRNPKPYSVNSDLNIIPFAKMDNMTHIWEGVDKGLPENLWIIYNQCADCDASRITNLLAHYTNKFLYDKNYEFLNMSIWGKVLAAIRDYFLVGRIPEDSHETFEIYRSDKSRKYPADWDCRRKISGKELDAFMALVGLYSTKYFPEHVDAPESITMYNYMPNSRKVCDNWIIKSMIDHVVTKSDYGSEQYKNAHDFILSCCNGVELITLSKEEVAINPSPETMTAFF